MRFAFALLLLAACEPSRQNRAEEFTRGLVDVYKWDPQLQAAGCYAYDELMGMGDDAIDALIEHITDTAETRIMELAHITVPTVGDVCFHMLLRLTGMKAQDFRPEGVVVMAEIENPIYGVRFDPGARLAVQKKFKKVLKR